jgi:hypothetical protein
LFGKSDLIVINIVMASYWLAKDKDGTIHFSNVKPKKPSEVFPDNPDANDGIFWMFDRLSDGSQFFIRWYDDVEGLTFENSPRQVKLSLI